MGKELYFNELVFKNTIDVCCAILKSHFNFELINFLFSKDKDYKNCKLQHINLEKIALFVVEYALAELLISWGIKPNGVIGYGIGEYTAAVIAKVFSLEDALVVASSQIMKRKSLSIKKVKFNLPNILFISSLTGGQVSTELCNLKYWNEQLIQSNKLRDAVKVAIEHKYLFFIEIISKDSLSNFINEPLKYADIVNINILPNHTQYANNEKSTYQFLLNALAKLWIKEIFIDWQAFNKGKFFYKKVLPTYPFEKKYHFINPDLKLINLSKKPIISEEINYYRQAWESDIFLRRKIKLNIKNKKYSWLIFLDEIGLGKDIGELLTYQSQYVICISFGIGFKAISATKYQINPSKKDDYIKLFKFLSQSGVMPDHILHFANLSGSSINIKSFDYLQQTGFYSLIYIAQNLFAINKPIKITVVSDYIKKVSLSDSIIPEKATLLGPCMVIPQEYINISLQYKDIIVPNAIHEKQQLIEQLIEDIIIGKITYSQANVTAYRNGFKWKEKLKLIKDTSKKPTKLSLHKKGIYVITGGLGNIGLEIANFLSSVKQIKIILINRYQASDHAYKISKLREIEKSGSQIFTLAGDISDEQWLKRAFKKIEKEVGLINGVIHAAGVTGELALTLIKDITPYEIKKQYASKVVGYKNVIKNINTSQLDFFILCSSLATILGGRGYAIYAAANCFLDAIAEEQIYSKILFRSINWDTWGFYKNSANISNEFIDMQSISIKDGIKSFEALFSNPFPRIAVTHLDLKNKIKDLLESNKKLLLNNKETEKPILHKECRYKSKLEKKLAALFEKCLSLKWIDRGKSFFDLGGHSLLAIQLVLEIEKEFQVNIFHNEIYQANSVEKIGKLIEEKRRKNYISSNIVKISSVGEGKPLFLLPPINGDLLVYSELVKYLSKDRLIYGVQDSGLITGNFDFTSFEEMALSYLEFIRKEQPHGPYFLLGSSMGGNLAFEIAYQLHLQNEPISLVCLLDSWTLFSDKLRDRQYFSRSLQKKIQLLENSSDKKTKFLPKFADLMWKRMELLCQYQPKYLDVPIVLFKAKELLPEYDSVNDYFNHWLPFAKTINLEIVDGDHDSMLKQPAVANLSQKLIKYF